MNVSEAIKRRRSIAKFDPHHTMSESEIRELIEAAHQTPSAFNIQHWRFVNIASPELREKFSEIAWHQPQVRSASLLLLICADLKAWAKEPERYCASAPDEYRANILEAMRNYYKDHPQTQRDEGFRSSSMAAMTLMLKAQEMGYDSCAMGGFDADKAAELVNLPNDYAICMMLAIGKKAAEPYPKEEQLALDEIVVTDSF